METLHSVLRAVRPETKPRRDHLGVFREFLSHLDRISRRSAPARAVKSGKGSRKTRGKR